MTAINWRENTPEQLHAAIGAVGASDRKCRLFAVALCRQSAERMPDPQTKDLVELAAGFIEGDVSKTRLRSARRRVYRWAYEEWGVASWRKDWVRYWAAWNAALPKITPPCIGFFRWATDCAEMGEDIFGSSFELFEFNPAWQTSTVATLARQMYESRDFSAMPILADALQDAGCDHPDVLAHCRGSGPHVRGCWVVDYVLGKI